MALSLYKPGLVVTTSHGQTGPINDLDQMKAKLGWLVDSAFQLLEPSKLLAAWKPDGAIWYAHACCSAGSASATIFRSFNGLIDPGSPIDQVLKAVANLGAQVAPLPKALLGATKPLRAFVGHVEPTFDWTIRQPLTGQYLTENIRCALYNNLFIKQPIGLAFQEYFAPLSTLYSQYDDALRAYNLGGNTQRIMLACLLAARDLQSMVILGDPTAVLPIP